MGKFSEIKLKSDLNCFHLLSTVPSVNKVFLSCNQEMRPWCDIDRNTHIHENYQVVTALNATEPMTRCTWEQKHIQQHPQVIEMHKGAHIRVLHSSSLILSLLSPACSLPLPSRLKLHFLPILFTLLPPVLVGGGSKKSEWFWRLDGVEDAVGCGMQASPLTICP